MKPSLLVFSLSLSLASLSLFAAETFTPVPRKAENTDLLRFLPADGNTVYPAARLLRKWPEGGPRLLWEAEVGGGRSAVVEAAGRAYTAGQSEGAQWGFCLEAKTGAVLWKHSLVARENHHGGMSGPVSSPVIDGDRIYFSPYDNFNNNIYDPRCPVICLKADGTEVWRENTQFWNTEGSTPLIEGDTLYLASGSKEHVYAAVNKLNGKLLWGTQVETDKKRIFGGAASIIYQEVAGIPQIVGHIYDMNVLVGIDARNGKILWKLPPPGTISSGLLSSPVAVGDKLLLSGGQNAAGAFFACFQMVPKDGGLEPRTLYVDRANQGNQTHTVAVVQDAVFGFGGAGAGALQCTNLADGKLLWEVQGEDWSREQQLIIADGLIFALTRKSELVLAEVSREGFKELSRFQLPQAVGKFPQQPTLANGHLYIRTEKHVLSYQIGE
jgi:outer membrane protein assembly factor BamB